MAVTNTILATAMGGTSVLVFNKLLVDHQYSFLTVILPLTFRLTLLYSIFVFVEFSTSK